MKKFCKLMTLVLVITLLLFTPGTSVAVNGLLKLAPADTTVQFTAPTQSSTPFDFAAVDTYDLATWTKPSGTYLITQQLTAETNNKFYEEHPENALKDIADRTPYVIASTSWMPANGGYTTSAITLSANGCYKISVEYYVVEQRLDADHTKVNTAAFGTFYLNDNAITLSHHNSGWDTAVFYVRTDNLETATVTPELYFGSRSENALGAIYFDKFTVNAVRQSTFDAEIENIDATTYIDFTNSSAYVSLENDGNFANEKFIGNTTTNADSNHNISTAELPRVLGFEEEQHDFFAKDGTTGNVMLLKANNADASLTLQDYPFQPRPHEVYMFQFYSIATALTEFGGFYFMIGNDAHQIPNIADYPYHNGWQLNTIFFVAGPKLKQEYKLSFNLGNGTATTGWACIDDFKIYKVNGSYAANNSTAVGVHNTNDQNAEAEALDIANGYFELGTAADNVNEGSSYPYPLVAADWTTNTTTNGIVNLHASLWHSRFGDNPGSIDENNYDSNNHVYMMHNANRTVNVLTSPALTTTNDATTYISFDACGYTAAETRAYILTADSDDNGNLTNEIILGNYITINDNGWHHYEFNIVEGAYANTRNYYLRFVMKGVGYTYIDNVRTTTEGAFQNATAARTTSADVDLTNPLAIDQLWQATDELTSFYRNATKNGLTLENENGQKTVIKNNFEYNLTADDYYEVVISAYGKNAYLGFSSYDGLLEVTTDTLNPETLYDYKLYIHPSDGATAVNFQVTLGYVGDDTDTAPIANGNIFINSIQINSITEDDFNNAKDNAGDEARLKVLSLAEDNDDGNNDVTYEDPDNSFFGKNWWYLVPTLITAIALFLAIATFLFRKIKFEKHITKKTTSYARDMQMKNQHNKIVAQKAAKVDNVTDEPQSK